MLKAMLLTTIFSLTACRFRALFVLIGLGVLTAFEVGYLTLRYHHSFMHGIRAFGVLSTLGELAYLAAVVLVFWLPMAKIPVSRSTSL